MCGGYARISGKQRISGAFHLGDFHSPRLAIAPSYNILPTSNQPVIVADQSTGKRAIRIMRWGLVPGWANDPESCSKTFNANAEVINIKPMWREPFHNRRCLVPADAYYEWSKIDSKTKQPYAYGMKEGAMFAFAGIWDEWMQPDSNQVLQSFSIIVADANKLTRVHSRMPVIIKPQDYERWLIGDGLHNPPIDLLRPYDSNLMRVWKVDQLIDRFRFDNSELSLESE